MKALPKMMALIFTYEILALLMMIPVAVMFYRQLQRNAPHRSAFIHFLMAGLAASALVGIGFGLIQILWPAQNSVQF